jgi:4-hydroxy-tetrahydrodipicolinate synthase
MREDVRLPMVAIGEGTRRLVDGALRHAGLTNA